MTPRRQGIRHLALASWRHGGSISKRGRASVKLIGFFMEGRRSFLYDSVMQQMTVEKAVELAEQYKARGKPAEAEHVYRQIIAASPQNVLVLNRLGICIAEAGRLAEARDIFLRAVEADPVLAAGWQNLSLAY